MSYLTKEQLDKYVKDLASKTPKTTSLNTKAKGSPLSKVSPNNPFSLSTLSSTTISTSERKAGALHGPRSPPPSTRNSIIATTSPKESVFSINDNEENENSSLNETNAKTTIVEPTAQGLMISKHSSVSSDATNSSDEKGKKTNYKNIDEMVNDLSYPMETKLSFKSSTSPLQPKSNNNLPPLKGSDNTTKGSYVLSASFRSSYGAASRTPSVKKSAIQPLPKQEQSEIISHKKQDLTIQEIQDRSDTNLNARFDQAQQKDPPLNKLDKDKRISFPPTSPSFPLQKQIKSSVNVGGIPPENSNPSTSSANSRQTTHPTSTLSPLDCASCGKSISGNILSAMGKKWHPDHFVCKKCGITLEHVAFFEKDGNPYCHLDFHELFSPRCGYCETPIEGQAINALGKSWHPGHFFCRECGNPFEGGFMVHEGFPYCEKDWAKLFAPKCKGCKENIKGEFMNALEGMWHRNCFVCMTCKEPFYSSYYYIFEGNPYCDKHYRDLLHIS